MSTLTARRLDIMKLSAEVAARDQMERFVRQFLGKRHAYLLGQAQPPQPVQGQPPTPETPAPNPQGY